MRRRRSPRPRPDAPLCPLSRHSRAVRLECVLRETPAAQPTSTDHGERLDRPLYCLLNAEGALCAAEVQQGECVLLFTSPAAAAAFALRAGVEARPPLVFSRSRSEFLTQAERSFAEGFIGGLVDPIDRAGKMVFLGFRE